MINTKFRLNIHVNIFSKAADRKKYRIRKKIMRARIRKILNLKEFTKKAKYFRNILGQKADSRTAEITSNIQAS